mmetsp:Transcript_5515/g.8653  ORF Transcript_5515/g.8653 Transcript_5515/m.8653 type:complete len:127 (-) Transcript_5515:24-404(-)
MKGQWLACTSDRSTIHIFTVSVKHDNAAIKLSDEEAKADEDDPQEKVENKKSKLNFIKGILPKYFDSEWSYARFKVPGDDNQSRMICGFSGDSNHLIVVSSEGKYFKATIPKSNGNCKIVETKSLV